jgi:glycosyltransferase involved in cell wall biosynthesis
MKILIISAFFPPQNTVAAQRPLSWAKYWSAEGHDVEVLTVMKDETYSEGSDFVVHEVEPSNIFKNIKNFYKSFLKKEGSNSGSIVQNQPPSFLARLKNYFFSRGLSTSTRMPDAFDFWITPAFESIKQKNKKYDVVLSSFGPYATHIVARKIKDHSIARYWIADYRDLWTQNEFFKGLPIFRWIEEILEKSLLRDADLVTTVSPPLAKKLADKFYLKNVNVIENGFDPTDIQKISPQNYFENSTDFNIAYTGSLYLQSQNVRPFFKALLKTIESTSSVKTHFFGSNAYLLDSLVKEYKLEKNVLLHSQISREESLQVQRDADCLLFIDYTSKSEEKDNGIYSGKVFEYLFAPTPILITGNDFQTSIANLVLKCKKGIFLGNHTDSFSNQIDILREAETFKGNQSQIQQFTRKNLAQKLLVEIQKLSSH